jgi:hypothetical protein
MKHNLAVWPRLCFIFEPSHEVLAGPMYLSQLCAFSRRIMRRARHFGSLKILLRADQQCESLRPFGFGLFVARAIARNCSQFESAGAQRRDSWTEMVIASQMLS